MAAHTSHRMVAGVSGFLGSMNEHGARESVRGEGA